MKYPICKTDYARLMTLVDKAVEIIKAGEPPPRDYNVARQLLMLRRKFDKKYGLPPKQPKPKKNQIII